ncbi:MAG: hypothetical protein ACFC03_01230 [Candidatus Malihini olakiniferum]
MMKPRIESKLGQLDSDVAIAEDKVKEGVKVAKIVVIPRGKNLCRQL